MIIKKLGFFALIIGLSITLQSYGTEAKEAFEPLKLPSAFTFAVKPLVRGASFAFESLLKGDARDAVYGLIDDMELTKAAIGESSAEKNQIFESLSQALQAAKSGAGNPVVAQIIKNKLPRLIFNSLYAFRLIQYRDQFFIDIWNEIKDLQDDHERNQLILAMMSNFAELLKKSENCEDAKNLFENLQKFFNENKNKFSKFTQEQVDEQFNKIAAQGKCGLERIKSSEIKKETEPSANPLEPAYSSTERLISSINYALQALLKRDPKEAVNILLDVLELTKAAVDMEDFPEAEKKEIFESLGQALQAAQSAGVDVVLAEIIKKRVPELLSGTDIGRVQRIFGEIMSQLEEQ